MKEFKGTPGKWNLVEVVDSTNKGEQVAFIQTEKYAFDISAVERKEIDRHEFTSNAKLIAASPDLLNACIELIKFTSEHKDHIKREELVKLTQSAINKALGL